MSKKLNDRSLSWSIETKLSEFNRVRYDLLKNNFVFLEVTNRLKLKLLEQLSKEQLKRLKNNPNDEIFVDILKPLRMIATMLQIDWMFLFSFMFYVEPGVRDFHEITIATESKEYLLEPGLYLKYHPWMTQDEWLDKMKKIKHIAKTMTKVSPPISLYPEVDAEEFFMEKQKHHVSAKDHEYNIQIYLDIESKIAEFLREKEIGSVKDPEYTEKSGISVIDRILESQISEIETEDDAELDRIKQARKNTYYEIAARYALPTFRELSKYLKQIG